MVANITRVSTHGSPRCFAVSARSTPLQDKIFSGRPGSGGISSLHRSAAGLRALGASWRTMTYNPWMATRKAHIPRCIVIAGPNGAGKTTFAREFLPRDRGVLNFVNADLIAAGLSPLQPPLAARAAARLVLAELDRLSNARLEGRWVPYWNCIPATVFATVGSQANSLAREARRTWCTEGRRFEAIFTWSGESGELVSAAGGSRW